MTRRITQLTPDQQAAMATHADMWIAHGLNTDPVDMDTFIEGARGCYEFAGIPWHGNVVRVASPIVGAFAAPIAAHLLRSGAVRGAVGVAVDDAVGGAVRGAVDDAVGDAVGGAVRDAVGGGWHRYIAADWWRGWQAYLTFFRDHCALQLDGDLWDRSRALDKTLTSAGIWWPYRQFVIVSDRPCEIHLEQIGPRGWESHRLHNPSGPALAWPDGWAIYAWHGQRVPAWVVEDPTPARIFAEQNAEVRRCAIESLGWPEFIAAAKLTMVGSPTADPGNPGQTLQLYDVPAAIYDEPVRVLICENASLDRDGRRRQFGLTVPAEIADPVAAAAWTFNVAASDYAELSRAT